MTEGLLPYRDFFDMKGPYLFFIGYIGQIICEGRSGAFCIQIINLTCSLYIIDKTYRIHKTKSDGMSFKDVIALLPCLYVASYTFEGGNLTEEFSLPLLLLGLYFAITYFENDEVRHPYRFGFFYGMVFGILSLIRITNASLIGAIILTISIELVVNKEFKIYF